MESIIEYSNLCDIISGISEINLNNAYIYRKQRYIVEESDSSIENDDDDDDDDDSMNIQVKLENKFVSAA